MNVSFAIYDEKNKNVFVAKDRLGKKTSILSIHNSTLEVLLNRAISYR